MYSIKELVLIPFVCYISVFHSKIILISYLSYIFVSYSNTNLRQYLLFFNENLNEFIQFYQFMCEYNPLLLNYVDDFDEELKNNDLKDENTSEIIKYEENVEKKIEEKYEDKYLKKFKNFPNKFIFDESELTQEIDEHDNIEFEFEKKRSMSICTIQKELSKINNITDCLNDDRIKGGFDKNGYKYNGRKIDISIFYKFIYYIGKIIEIIFNYLNYLFYRLLKN